MFLNYLTRKLRSKSEYRKRNLNMLECYMEQANIEEKKYFKIRIPNLCFFYEIPIKNYRQYKSHDGIDSAAN